MDLIEFWRRAPLGEPPYMHPEDLATLRKLCPQDLAQARGAESDPDRLHFGLLPQPFLGDLASADIFILTYKPGFGAGGAEYRWERDAAFQRALRTTIAQRFAADDPRFLFLAPRFPAHPGSAYWRQTFGALADEPALAGRVAVLELMPYHKMEGDAVTDRLARQLASSEAARAFVHDVVLPRSRRGEALVLAVRQVTNWGLASEPESPTFLKYTQTESRRALIRPGARGGDAILRKLRGAAALVAPPLPVRASKPAVVPAPAPVRPVGGIETGGLDCIDGLPDALRDACHRLCADVRTLAGVEETVRDRAVAFRVRGRSFYELHAKPSTGYVWVHVPKATYRSPLHFEDRGYLGKMTRFKLDQPSQLAEAIRIGRMAYGLV